MAKRLWAGSIEVDIVVEAESEEKARQLIERHAGEELSNRLYESPFVRSLSVPSDLPLGWDSAIPWGADDDRTCAERLNEDR